VRFVEDHRVARRQQLGQALVAQRDVGEEQMVVDDDDVGIERFLARLHHEALAVEGAVAAEAVVARRRDERPDRRVLRDVGELGAVTALRCAREGDDLRQVACIGPRRQPPFARCALQMVMAHVVRATLEQRDGDRRRERVADHRQVAFEQLILQRLRARRHDDLAPVEQRRHEVRERLARAGAGLGDQRLPQRDRACDRLRHLELLRAETEPRELVREGTAVAEDRGELGVQRAGSRVVWKRSVQFAFALAFALGFASAAPFAVRAGSVCFSTMATIVRIPSMRTLKSSYGNPTRFL
jgi:hypothetical protein